MAIPKLPNEEELEKLEAEVRHQGGASDGADSHCRDGCRRGEAWSHVILQGLGIKGTAPCAAAFPLSKWPAELNGSAGRKDHQPINQINRSTTFTIAPAHLLGFLLDEQLPSEIAKIAGIRYPASTGDAWSSPASTTSSSARSAATAGIPRTGGRVCTRLG